MLSPELDTGAEEETDKAGSADARDKDSAPSWPRAAPTAADEDTAQIEFRHLRQPTAQGGDGSIRQHHLQAEHVVAGDAV
ncbi:MAG: hypothetical protein ACKOPN_00340, partial [Prochlorococcaceae cyanobacterium]